MKRVSALALAIIMAFGLSTAASAASPKNSAESEATYQASVARYDELYREYAKKIIPLHDQYAAKMMELRALENLPSTTKNDVTNVIAELSKLKNEMRQEQERFHSTLQKENLIGVDSPCREGEFGMHGPRAMDGHGMGYHDGERRGYGKNYHHGNRKGHRMGYNHDSGKGYGRHQGKASADCPYRQ